MKINFKNSLFALTLLVVIAFGCKKDSNSMGSFTYDGKSYNFSNGILAEWGSNNGITAYSLLLYNGFKLYMTNNAIDSITGTGTGIELAFILSNDSTGLTAGDYAYDVNLTDAFTFAGGSVVVNYSFNDDSGIMYNINDGSMTVARSGKTHNVSFDLTEENNKAITGKFNGNLPIYQISITKSTQTHKLLHK